MNCDIGEVKLDFKVKINSEQGAKIELQYRLTKLFENAQKAGIDFDYSIEDVRVIN